MAETSRRIKSVEGSIRDTDEPEHRLRKNLSGLDLAVFEVGVIIGTGIFVLTGVVARNQQDDGQTRPDLPRSFRVPLVPLLPIASALGCLWLMANL
ncbi:MULTISPECIES: hypothetical protein [unclassified Geodermatophilus]